MLVANNLTQAIEKIATTIPKDLKFYLTHDFKKLMENLDSLFPKVELLKENLKDYTDSLKMTSEFFK